jgi:uncharacterized membrane protein
MADANTAPQMPMPQSGAQDSDSARTMAIIVYGLFLSTWVGFAIGPLIGVILAYIKRGESRGTIYESHFSNAIETFWVSLLMTILGALTVLVGIGIFILIGMFVWYLYRTIKGLVQVIDSRAYA